MGGANTEMRAYGLDDAVCLYTTAYIEHVTDKKKAVLFCFSSFIVSFGCWHTPCTLSEGSTYVDNVYSYDVVVTHSENSSG